MSEWPAGRHLAAIYDALYSSLGEGAPRAASDAAVVRLHEASRAFGELALELRDGGVLPDDALGDVVVSSLVARSLVDDPTGALTLYAVSMLLGPRLLVSLRDYLVEEDDEWRRAVMRHGSDLVVREIRTTGQALAGEPLPEGPAWSLAARALLDALDGAGMAESLGRRS
ncbi:MAG: hypothetical protein KGL23_09195 [Acidobacteriota bacterium]|nr:hypothetical protein [Acidobacteriota bacterium]MDE3147592.1 hypothetical protein [Acidobacteriota bacterium]